MSARTQVMAIVNRTPDSFYDGGRMGLDESLRFALNAIDEGADIVDVGGVKAGPGAPVSETEEMERLLPLVGAIAGETATPISAETGRANVAAAAIDAGVSIVNDVTGLADEGLAKVVAERGVGLVIMHHGGQIRGRPRNPTYDDIVTAVLDDWSTMAERAASAGIDRSKLIVDPGLDFGKNTFHSLALMRGLDRLVASGWPVLVAPSRKDVVGETLDLPLEDRLEGTLALVALSAAAGAAIVRVHDVAPSVRVARMVDAVLGRIPPENPVRGLWD